MRSKPPCLTIACVLLLLAGCGGQDHSVPRGSRPSSSPSAPPHANPSPPIDSTSADAATAWIRGYYRAIDERRYQDAYDHWEQNGQASGKSFEAFQKGFEQTASVDAIVGGPGLIGAAAGSRFVEVPVQIMARSRDGRQESYSGAYTLRLSVVDGATPEQRTWHIYRAHLKKL